MDGIYKISTRHLQDLQARITMVQHACCDINNIEALSFSTCPLFHSQETQSATGLCRESIMELLSLPESLLLNVLSLLHWSHLLPVAQTCSKLRRVAEDWTLHRSRSILIDLDLFTYNYSNGVVCCYMWSCLEYVLERRQLEKVEVFKSSGPILYPSTRMSFLVRLLHSQADSLEDLVLKVPISEDDFSRIVSFSKLRVLRIDQLWTILPQHQDDDDQHNVVTAEVQAKMASWRALRDSWTLPRLECLTLLGDAWRLVGGVQLRRGRGDLPALCCLHTEWREMSISAEYGSVVAGGSRLERPCTSCNYSSSSSYSSAWSHPFHTRGMEDALVREKNQLVIKLNKLRHEVENL